MRPRNPVPSAIVLPAPPADFDIIHIRAARARQLIPVSLTLLSTASCYFLAHLLLNRDGTRYLNLSSYPAPTVQRMLYFIERDSLIISPPGTTDKESAKTNVGKWLELVKLAEEVEYERLKERAVSMLVYELRMIGSLCTAKDAKEALNIAVEVSVEKGKVKDDRVKNAKEARVVMAAVDKWMLKVVNQNRALFEGSENEDLKCYLEERRAFFGELLEKRRRSRDLEREREKRREKAREKREIEEEVKRERKRKRDEAMGAVGVEGVPDLINDAKDEDTADEDMEEVVVGHDIADKEAGNEHRQQESGGSGALTTGKLDTRSRANLRGIIVDPYDAYIIEESSEEDY